VSDDPTGQVPTSERFSPPDGLEPLTEEVLPALIARLRASRLGELEVRTDSWRIRLRRDVNVARQHAGADSASDEAGLGHHAGVARSPAVGYFNPAASLVVGQTVLAGDSLGSVDVLGIVQDVAAPTGGIVSRVLAETGQAVEYGQALADIDPLDAGLGDDSEDVGAAAVVVD